MSQSAASQRARRRALAPVAIVPAAGEAVAVQRQRVDARRVGVGRRTGAGRKAQVLICVGLRWKGERGCWTGCCDCKGWPTRRCRSSQERHEQRNTSRAPGLAMIAEAQGVS